MKSPDPEPDDPPTGGARRDKPEIFISALLGTAALGGLAFIIAGVTGISLNSQFAVSFADFLIGVAATIPLLAFLAWFMQTQIPAIEAFRESQIEFFAEIGFDFTPARILAMSLFAGIFEELLFRGAIQTAIAQALPVSVAILIAAIAFGVVHWRTALYALIAGAVGIWLGVIFWLTGNLLAPMVTHALYDIAALAVTSRAIQQRRTATSSAPEE